MLGWWGLTFSRENTFTGKGKEGRRHFLEESILYLIFEIYFWPLGAGR